MPTSNRMFSKYFKVHYWPAITSGWFLLTFTVSYLVALLTEHVQEFIPFISDTGAIPPESCILGQLMNIGAIIMAITMYIRYRQVDFAINSKDINLQRGWNDVAFWSGNIVCFGVSVVGNFQKYTVTSIHFVGAFMAFGVAALYLLAQTRITFAFRPFYNKHPEYEVGEGILYWRLFLNISYFILFTAVIICGAISARKHKGTETVWTEESEGFELHLAATLSEWLMFFVFIAYTLTGTKEFKSVEFEEIRFTRKPMTPTTKT